MKLLCFWNPTLYSICCYRSWKLKTHLYKMYSLSHSDSTKLAPSVLGRLDFEIGFCSLEHLWFAWYQVKALVNIMTSLKEKESRGVFCHFESLLAIFCQLPLKTLEKFACTKRPLVSAWDSLLREQRASDIIFAFFAEKIFLNFIAKW